VLVTHDRFEALALGDAVVVFHAGRNVQQGEVHEVFSRPMNLAVAELTAVETIQPGRVLEMHDGLATVSVNGVRLSALAVEGLAADGDVYVCIRAEDVVLMRAGAVPASARNRLAVTVLFLEPEGPQVRVNLAGDFPLTALLTRVACEELGLQPGNALIALVKTPQVHLIPFTK
jgi:molybdate transport system ATP-binding protein